MVWLYPLVLQVWDQVARLVNLIRAHLRIIAETIGRVLLRVETIWWCIHSIVIIWDAMVLLLRLLLLLLVH